MARADKSKEEREQPLSLPALIDCEECETTFEHVFVCAEGVTDREDLTEAPEDDVECPACGHKQHAEYEGWVIHQEA